MKKLLLFYALLCSAEVLAQEEGDLSDFLNQPLPTTSTPKLVNNHSAPRYVPLYGCLPEPFDRVAGVPLYEWSESKSFYFFETKMAIDADGSPRAYHPQDKGLDKLEYAGRQGNWWALVTDNGKPNGSPILQKENDPYPGYYISMTATVYSGYADKSPQRYIDSEKIPYFVLNPDVMRSTGTQKGDIGYVYNRKTKKGCYAILGDVGSNQKLGEGSIYLAKQLGINADPRIGGQDDGVVYMVFPFSGNGAARSLADINAIGEKLMNKADGSGFIKTCLNTQNTEKSADIVSKEEVSGEMIETRLAYLAREVTSTQPYFATHSTLPIGSIVSIRNTQNNKICIAQIIARSERFGLSRKVFEMLAEGNETSFQVEIVYPK